LAARVNGQAILLREYEKEVERCQAGKSDPANCPALVLQNLIEQRVVEQAALTSGVAVSEADVDAELQRITDQLGGLEAYQAWLTANLYTDDEFRQALRRDLLRARMADQVTANIGDQAEQVHARELLVADEATAQDLLAQIKGGKDFVELAVIYSIDLSSRIAGGDLGWFPRGLLTVPEVEQAAFTLQPGETSEVIHSTLGYHIVQTLEHDPVHPLSPGARQALLNRTYQTWLERQLAEATIEKVINP
jgi:peptidyl-prolyl cis-trans isomerase C